MTSRQNGILVELGFGAFVSTQWLATAVNAPAPTVRRNIAALRTKGYDIRPTTLVGLSGYQLHGRTDVTTTDAPVDVTPSAYDTDIDTTIALDADDDTSEPMGADPYEDDDFYDDDFGV